MCACICVRVYIYIYIHIYLYVCLYIYIYIQENKHMRNLGVRMVVCLTTLKSMFIQSLHSRFRFWGTSSWSSHTHCKMFCKLHTSAYKPPRCMSCIHTCVCVCCDYDGMFLWIGKLPAVWTLKSNRQFKRAGLATFQIALKKIYRLSQLRSAAYLSRFLPPARSCATSGRTVKIACSEELVLD